MTVARLEKYYNESIRGSLKKEFAFTNDLSIPKLDKIVVSMMTKDAISSSKVISTIYDELFLITGQKPIITKAKKSIATFKLREGMKIGVKVTLRRKIMYEFLDRLINIALPRINDFKGLDSKHFDKRGNYSIGIKEHIVFPEIDYSRIDKIRGLGISIVTTSSNDKHARYLLNKFNLPFKN